MKEAKRRIEASPGRYVPKVYGETDGGGASPYSFRHSVNTPGT